MKLQKLTLLLFVALTLVSQFSCNILGVQGPEAAFVSIPSLKFTHSLEMGPLDHNMKHVEVFFENVSIGYYEIPVILAVIPTMEMSNITIRPAIRENGQANAIAGYPIMKNFSLTQEFAIGETYDIIPEFDYVDNIVLDYLETFESGNSFEFDLDMIDSTTLLRSTEEANNSTYSGLLSSEEGPSIEVATDFVFTDLRNNGREVYAEISYFTNEEFIFGLVAFNTGLEDIKLPLIGITAKEEWNKTYINLTNVVLQFPSEGYRLYFALDKGAGSIPSKAYIDNIKLLHIP